MFAKTSPRASIDAGVGLLTEDRKGEGLLMHLSVAANIVAPQLDKIARGPFIDLRAEDKIGAREIERFLDRSAWTANSGRRVVRWQPAESAIQPVGPHLPPRYAAGRADPRH